MLKISDKHHYLCFIFCNSFECIICCYFNLFINNNILIVLGSASIFSFFFLIFIYHMVLSLDFLGSTESKEPACNAGDPGSIPGSGRCPGEGNGNPLQYSCLENPHGQKSLVGYSPWSCKESDMNEWLTHSLVSACLVISSYLLDDYRNYNEKDSGDDYLHIWHFTRNTCLFQKNPKFLLGVSALQKWPF